LCCLFPCYGTSPAKGRLHHEEEGRHSAGFYSLPSHSAIKYRCYSISWFPLVESRPTKRSKVLPLCLVRQGFRSRMLLDKGMDGSCWNESAQIRQQRLPEPRVGVGTVHLIKIDSGTLRIRLLCQVLYMTERFHGESQGFSHGTVCNCFQRVCRT